MKKILALALVLAFTLSVPAFAADLDQDTPSGTAEIQVTIDPTYTVTIPQDLTIPFGALHTEFGVIAMPSARLDPGYYVEVTPSSDYQLKNQADSSKTIPYVIMQDNGLDFEKVGFVQSGADSGQLYIDITEEAWNAAPAGAYKDTVIFTLSYAPAP